MGILHYEDGKRTDILHTFNDEITDDDWAIRSQINMGELATRLGSVQGFDNRGREIFSDRFESTTLKWNTTVTNGSTLSRQTDTAWAGDASMRANHPAVPAPAATLYKQLYNPGTGRYGVEVSVAFDTLDWGNLRLQLYGWTGTYDIESFIQVDGGSGEIFYFGGGGVNVSLGQNIDLFSDLHFWHKLKLVIDINKQEYVRILVDGVEFDMEGISLHSSVNGTGARLQPMLYSVGGGVNINNIYWDNFVYSHLEQ